MPDDLTDDVIWSCLAGPHARFSAGGPRARRYAKGFSPIVAFPVATQPDFDALSPLCEPGEHFYVGGWSGPMPSGWVLEAEARMVRMAWDAPLPDDAPLAPGTRPLAAADAAAAMALAELTRPGPFGLRTIELGEYLGCFEDGRLVAIAGERMQSGPWREISSVCTHPDQQGRGLARQLMLALLRRAMLRGERPFLHVMSANAVARGLYRRMGFRELGETAVRVIALA